MNLGELETLSYDRLGIEAIPDTFTIRRLRSFANETHREILRIKHFRRFRRRLLTVASTSGSPFMALPTAAVRVFGFQDRTNDTWLTEKDLSYIRQMDPGLRATAANPWLFAPFDLASPVAVQPSDASEIFVKSTSASDTNTAYIEGVRTGGYPTVLAVAMTGVTAKSFSAAQNDIVAINKFYLSQPAVGTVTLNEDSGAGTTLATIPIGRVFGRYSVVHLYPTPSASVMYYADAEVHVEDMVNITDEPLLPEEFHHLIATGIRMREYEKREKWDAYAQVQAEMVNGIAKMKTWINQRAGSLSETPARHSMLGPWFEPGT